MEHCAGETVAAGKELFMHRRLTFVSVVTVMLALPAIASAGMGAVTFNDVGEYLSLTQLTRERLQAISFFAAGFLLSAAFVRVVWNSLAKDFPRLPRLSYSRALGLVFLWGLLFLLVLTMISGARELMTPGAWEKKGILYRLKAAEPEARPVEDDDATTPR